jgi:RNA-directed DNA polymerase
MRQIKKVVQSGEGIKYYIKIDIRHFYANIKHDVLKKVLRQRIKDEWFIGLIMRCLQGFKKGLPLGFYISQWLANYFLEELDFLIAKEPDVTMYMRYADDMTVFIQNKKRAHELLTSIMRYLGKERRLKLKNNYQVIRFDYTKKNGKRIGRPLDFMGFVFYRDHIVMRKRTMIKAARISRKIADAKSNGRKTPIKNARAVVSLLGWFKHTDSYDCYLKHIKPFLRVKRIKNQISNYDKVRSNYDRMDARTVGVSA